MSILLGFFCLACLACFGFFVVVVVALRVCQFRGFVLGHTGAFVRRSGVAVLFWCFGFVCLFKNWQCVALFCCIFWLFCVYLVSLTLGFFS
jgi:hypothetical protein